MRTYWSETLQRRVTIPTDTEETTMTHSPESASTPISAVFVSGECGAANPDEPGETCALTTGHAGRHGTSVNFPGWQDHGTLTDYTTGEAIRPATAAEHAQSLAAGETGAYRDDDGRAVFVAGGPESLA
jgi:hypothetical protein